MVAAQYVQAALGIPAVTWFANPPAVIGNQVVAAVAAVAAGMCETALVYHHAYRLPWASRAAAADPFRRRATLGVADARSVWGTGHVRRRSRLDVRRGALRGLGRALPARLRLRARDAGPDRRSTPAPTPAPTPTRCSGSR